MSDWLKITRQDAPLLLSMPHTGTDLPPELDNALVSPWLARRDTDWWIEKLYDFAVSLGATVIRTTISRTAIDMNRDPTGASLYPGQNTTELCPTSTFDGDPLYRRGAEPDADAITARLQKYYAPYHAALVAEIARLRQRYASIVLYDCHSIRSRIPRMFEAELPHFNIGTNSGASCAPALTQAVEAICDSSGFSRVTNGRFKGGHITRHYGQPGQGIHAIQMELAFRGYLREPTGALTPDNWPAPYDEDGAAPMRAALRLILETCLGFAGPHPR